MIHDLLKQLDFNEKGPIGKKVYFAERKITPAEIAKITRINRTTVYSVSSDLIKRGVIAEDLGGRIRYLVARPPEDLSEILRKDENDLQEKKKVIEKAITELKSFSKHTVYSVPKIVFISEDDLESYLYKRSANWCKSIMEYDGVWWGFQDPTFVLHYQKWIDWFWQNVASSGLVLNLLSNKAAIEKVMQEKEYANRRNIKVWKETKKFTGTLWVAGDYVVTLNDKDDRADLLGWVTIDNKSGAAYKNARLKLVAGDVNRVKNEYDYKDKMLRVAEMAARSPAVQFKEEEFFEYHIYTLQRQATIKDNQTKQINLVKSGNIPVKKELLYYGASYYYHNRYGEAISNQKVGVFVEIANKKEHNLGMPLPKGTVRVYKHDKEGGLQFVGEDSIDHTPKDEKVRIKLGDAFDVVGSRKQTDWKKIAYDTYEAAFEISLRNHKKEDVVVKVVEPIPGDWKMLNSSHEYKKTEAFTAEFNIPAQKDKEVKLTYRVRMRY
jgi:hypothetical protein